MILAAPVVHTGLTTLEPGWVRTEGDRVVEVGPGAPPGPAESFDGVLTPGFVDMHGHGGGGAAFTDGATSAATVTAAHLAHGTTTMIASLVTDTIDALAEQIEALRPLVDAGDLAGVHLEGPWISLARSGAHDPDRLKEPLLADVRRLCSGPVRMVTIAPELPGAEESIRAMTRLGIVVAIGHTNATTHQAEVGFEAGATVVTHLFNAMRPVHHREPGPIWVATRRASWLELIADGIHLHPLAVHDVMTSAPDRVVLITDAMAAAACSDGSYQLGPMQVTVVGGRATISGTDRIAGSSLTLSAALRFAVQEAGVPLDVAVRAATANPAAALGLDDVGLLQPGRRADVVALTPDLAVAAVMRCGVWA